MTNPTLKVIADRRSCRAYTAEPVSKAELDAVIEAGILAPSARNLQQRRLTVVRNAALLDEMAAEILPLIGKTPQDEYHVFYHAPVVIAISIDCEAHWGKEDAGILIENMSLAAESMGLGSCILGLPHYLFDSPQGQPFLRRMGVPENYRVVLCMTLGHKAQAEIPAKPRNRDVVDYVD